jgi:crossover junction endodeoxyribonuclease RusA
MSAFAPKGWTRAVITSANPKLKKWRKLVRDEAVKVMDWRHPAGKNIALSVTLSFFIQKAKSNRQFDCVKKPDLDKLVRGILDSLTKVIFDDDSQVVEIHATKEYGEPRVEIAVEEVGLVPVKVKHQPIKDADLPFS